MITTVIIGMLCVHLLCFCVMFLLIAFPELVTKPLAWLRGR